MRRTFELLVSSVQNQVGWSVFLVLYLGQYYMCVCVRACFHIVLHVWYIWNSNTILGAHACFLVASLLMLARLWGG